MLWSCLIKITKDANKNEWFQWKRYPKKTTADLESYFSQYKFDWLILFKRRTMSLLQFIGKLLIFLEFPTILLPPLLSCHLLFHIKKKFMKTKPPLRDWVYQTKLPYQTKPVICCWQNWCWSWFVLDLLPHQIFQFSKFISKIRGVDSIFKRLIELRLLWIQ